MTFCNCKSRVRPLHVRSFTRAQRRPTPMLIQFAQIESGLPVLEVGCGPSPFAEKLAERGSGRSHATRSHLGLRRNNDNITRVRLG